MRAKMKVAQVTANEGSDTLVMRPVTNGTPEDNTYSKFTPCGELSLTVTNEALMGQFKPGETFYVDFTPVNKE
jgi:hypothetical protein